MREAKLVRRCVHCVYNSIASSLFGMYSLLPAHTFTSMPNEERARRMKNVTQKRKKRGSRRLRNSTFCFYQTLTLFVLHTSTSNVYHNNYHSAWPKERDSFVCWSHGLTKCFVDSFFSRTGLAWGLELQNEWVLSCSASKNTVPAVSRN